MIAVDTETLPFGPGRMVPPLVCVSMAHDDGSAWLWHHSEPYGYLCDALLVGVVGCNVAYDMAVIGNAYDLLPEVFAAYDADRVTDIALRQQLIDLAAGTLGWHEGRRCTYSLAELAQRHLGIELAKEDTWRTRYAELRDVPLDWWPEDARDYALDDARATWLVWEAQEQCTQWLQDQYRQARAAFWLHLMSAWGLRTDPERVAAFARRTREEYDRLSAELVSAGLKRPDRFTRTGRYIEGARDTKAAAARLEAAMPTCARTPTGKVQLDEDACIASGDPVLAAYGRFGKVSKTLKADVPLVERGTAQPIHARFTTIVETGRVACSNPNLMNLPTD